LAEKVIFFSNLKKYFVFKKAEKNSTRKSGKRAQEGGMMDSKNQEV